MKKPTKKINEKSLDRIISESIRMVLNENMVMQSDINDFHRAVKEAAIGKNIMASPQAIMNVANTVYKEKFSKFDYNELIDAWKLMGGIKSVAFAVKGAEDNRPSWTKTPTGRPLDAPKSDKVYESIFKGVVSESIQEAMNEGGQFFAVCDDEWDKPFKEVNPISELKEDEINEDGEILVNGKWDFVLSECTNFYADKANRHAAEPGDLVFDYLGNNVVYRRGLGAPASCETSMGATCLIGTENELIKHALEFADEIKQDTGIDTRELFGK